ncbi:MAG: transglutaminase-like domain-containing protein [bacterium]|nr:transglutaminase-like domain-containing protein [bacterium]
MSPQIPLCCNSRGFDLLKQQPPIINSPDALMNGAIAIAMHQLADVEPGDVDAQLQAYVDRIRKRVRGRQAQALMAHMHDILFEEEGYRGNTEDYYSVVNSYLPAVMMTKRGMPITLALIYKIVAERLGLHVYGIGIPGHFLIGIKADGGPMIIDPFHSGRILTPDEVHSRLQEMFGPEVEWSEEQLLPASNRHWLTHILQNMLTVFEKSGQFNDVAAVLEMEMLLWPEHIHLQRDLGLVLARCGLSQPAFIWLDRYVRASPDDPQVPQLQYLLNVLSP